MTGGDAPMLAPVLLVEDEALIRSMLADAFSDAGFDVIEASSADAAVEVVGARRVAAVVTDVRMPGTMDGLALAAWLRQHRPGVPVVVTSGYLASADQDALRRGGTPVLSKPYDPGEVVAIIATALSEPDAGAL